MFEQNLFRLLKVHFDGWEEDYDQWMDCESVDIYPVSLLSNMQKAFSEETSVNLLNFGSFLRGHLSSGGLV